MIIVKLNGGLGNQLFQVCAGLTLENDIRLLKFDVSRVNTKSLQSLIGCINLCGVSEYKRQSKLTGIYFLDRCLKALYKRFPIFFSHYRYWNNPADTDLIVKGDNNVVLDGYWQDLNLISDTIPILSKMIRYEKFSPEFHFFTEKHLKMKTVSVHVRRGDYVTPEFKSKFDVCDAQYYLDAIEIMIEKMGADSHFVFFTNDISWVSENLMSKIKNVSFVSGENLTDYEELILIGRSNAAIIPNSTFSWWGVQLSSNCEYIICPKTWFVKEDRPELIPNSWIRV